MRAVSSHDPASSTTSRPLLAVDYETIVPTPQLRPVRPKQEERARKEHAIARQEKEIEAHQANIDRFKAKATKARQAASKQKLLDRIVIERLPRTSRRYPAFRFQQVRPSGKVAVEAVGISKRYGDKRCSTRSARVQRGTASHHRPQTASASRRCSGLMGKLQPDAGTSAWGYETYPGYFAHTHREQLDDSAETVETGSGATAPRAHRLRARASRRRVFSGDDVAQEAVGALRRRGGAPDLRPPRHR